MATPPHKKPRGRPRSKMSEDVVAGILRLVRAGMYADNAAQALGIAPSTMRSHRKRHPSFDESVRTAERVAEASALCVVQKNMNAGSLAAATWFLERRHPEGWARAEIRASIATVNVDTDALTAALLEGVKLVGERWADPSEPDVEDTPEYRTSPANPANQLCVEMQPPPTHNGGATEKVPLADVDRALKCGWRHMPDHPDYERTNSTVSRT